METYRNIRVGVIHGPGNRIIPVWFDLKQRKLSMDAPLARALLGKRVDDEVVVSTPSGEQTWYLVDIRYDS